MVSIKYLKQYCKDYTSIPNYQEALNDTENLWECHHLLEEFYTKSELKELGKYFNVPANELVLCRTRKEHRAYPHKGDSVMGLKHHGLKFSEETLKLISENSKKRRLSEESKRKIGDANRGRKRPDLAEIAKTRKGIPLSEETRKKISQALTGKKRGAPSEETKRKIGESQKGRKAWNKGKHLMLGENGKRCYQ